MSVSKVGRNTVEAPGVLKELEAISREFQIEIIPMMDSSDYIRQSISNVGTGPLRRGVRDPGPSSSCATSAARPSSPRPSCKRDVRPDVFGGLTLNIMTLGGLRGWGCWSTTPSWSSRTSSGLRETGEARGRRGQRREEVTAAITANTLTTVVVFLPMVFIRGMSGSCRQLAFVVGFALCSMAAAMTLVPMLAARILPEPRAASVAGRRSTLSAGFFKDLEKGYRQALHWALDHRVLVTLVAAALVGGSVYLMRFVGSELLPATDEGEVQVNAEMAVGTRVAVVDETFLRVEDLVREAVPEAKTVVTSIGGGGFGASASHTANMRLRLVPVVERQRSSEDIAADLRRSSGHPRSHHPHARRPGTVAVAHGDSNATGSRWRSGDTRWRSPTPWPRR
jgi:HAE1 family hydrophobic/amphiphilic exporter-1